MKDKIITFIISAFLGIMFINISIFMSIYTTIYAIDKGFIQSDEVKNYYCNSKINEGFTK